MKITPFYGRGWESNSYLVSSDGHAALIDAGVATKTLLETLEKENVKLEYILLTHGHFDHTITADEIRKSTDAKLMIHEKDTEMLADPEKSALALFFGRYDTVAPCDIALRDGDSILLGSQELKVIHTPGHSKGSVCYIGDGCIFTGDTLFDGGFGRFDLHGGSFEELKNSLRSLKSLNPNLDMYSGHGTSAKLGEALELLTII